MQHSILPPSENIYYTYIWHRPNGEPFYVGKGKDGRAWIEGRNTHFNNVIAKLKRNNLEPTVEIVKENISNEEAKELEIFLIAYYGRADLGLGPLTNQTNGGEGTSGRVCSAETRVRLSVNKGKKRSVETRAKISKAMKGKNHPMYGKRKSAEHRAKLAKANKGENSYLYGKKRSAESRHKQSETWRNKPDLVCPTCDKVYKKQKSFDIHVAWCAMSSY